MNKYYYQYSSPIGVLKIVEQDNKLQEIALLGKEENNIMITKTPLLTKVCKELDEYFEGKRTTFDIPLDIKGTLFEQNVYKQLINIPYGSTKTYKEIAELIKHDMAYRAVGKTNNKNKILIIIPCHRVIGTNNKLVGYRLGLDIKKYLLDLENKNTKG